MACALTPTCRGTAERHPQEWSRRVEGTDAGVPPPQPPASVACRVRKRETPFTLALARYLGLVLRARKRPMLGPRRDPNPQPPGNVSPRPETESHRPASQSCVIGSAVALEWNQLATARLTGHEQCSCKDPAQAGWRAPPRDPFGESGDWLRSSASH